MLTKLEDNGKVGEVWAIKLSNDGQYLAGTTHDGHIKVWDLQNGAEQIRDFETKGSFGMCIDIVCSYRYLCMASVLPFSFSHPMVDSPRPAIRVEVFIFLIMAPGECLTRYQVSEIVMNSLVIC